MFDYGYLEKLSPSKVRLLKLFNQNDVIKKITKKDVFLVVRIRRIKEGVNKVHKIVFQSTIYKYIIFVWSVKLQLNLN